MRPFAFCLCVVVMLPAAARSMEGPSKPLRGLGVVHNDGAALPRLAAGQLKAPPSDDEEDLVISFKARDGAIERGGKFRVATGAQANYVAGGETPQELPNKLGTGIEFKKHAVVVNIVATSDGKNGAAGEIQVEISGVQPADPKSVLHEPPVSTFQLQTRFHAQLGKPVVLVDEPGRRFELVIERAE